MNGLVCASLCGILDAKIVDHQSKCSAIGGVQKKAWGECLMVVMNGEIRVHALDRKSVV